MKRIYLPLILLLFIKCSLINAQKEKFDFTVAFGSCNNQIRTNNLWDDIVQVQPDVWIWGGDNIYSDTYDMSVLRSNYNLQLGIDGYKKLRSMTPIMGTWDDHDYGKNDGGVEYKMKRESQQLFLDFLGVAKNNARRKQEGVYTFKDFHTKKGSVRVIVLDTRYFRTGLTKASGKKRYRPNKPGEGTILGATQWKWLRQTLEDSKANFNIVVSSIQVLSGEHGFETWANFPAERDMLFHLIANSGARGVIVLSGDRHISEFSKKESIMLPYPLIDFTSSGLTHAYKNFSGEPNSFRVGEVVHTESFGVLRFNFGTNTINMQMIGDNNEVLNSLSQTFK
ncbi:alkaline phosphatase D family protein [Spongiivirga sp. MCCC 1A20706]|uniref:alkaline phosphatase D family protein n=1 Tax=Spongiivirga sp. MCCC 1A20706 TaxID=3160963 RepID=UPI0039778B7D